MDENRHLGDTYGDHTGGKTSYNNLGDLNPIPPGQSIIPALRNRGNR